MRSLFFVLLASPALWACSSENPAFEPDAEADSDADADADAGAAADADADDDTGPRALATRDPMRPAPASGLPAAVASCPRYLDTRCADGLTQRCEVFDTAAGDFTEAPDPMLRRAHLFERWYELYHAPDGQTANRNLAGETLPGTPEAEWGRLAHFAGYDAIGDTAIWTGVGLMSFVLRYAVNGTEAEYQRLETKLRQTLALFDVTGVDGYLARHHAIVLPDDAPPTDAHLTKREGTYNPSFHDHETDPAVLASADTLPVIYSEGVGTPVWLGNPSIDQYSGPLTGFAAAYQYLRDEALRERVVTHVTCYLKRLERVEIVHLQDNPDALAALQPLLVGSSPQVDEGDIDLAALDTMVVYVLPQLNEANADSYPRGCPDALQLEPSRVIDATGDEFYVDVLDLYLDYEGDQARERGIDHYYAINVSGPHALTLMYLATLAWHLTGDDQYRAFLEDELIGNQRAVDVAYIAGAFALPRWCRKFYADHILFKPVWSFLELLEPGPLKDQLYGVVHEELWGKLMFDVRNLELDMLYAALLPEALAPAREQALAEVEADLPRLGGNGGELDDPRRSYTIDRAWMLENLPEGVAARCPTEAERERCEAGVELFGLTLEGASISHECHGGPGECPMEDGLCTDAMTSVGMPVPWRPYEGFLWEGHPFHIGRGFGVEGGQQSPGLDVIEAYWMARYYGLTDAGTGQVLAWRPTPDPCSE